MKKIVSFTLSKDLVKWIEKQVKKEVKYRNKSHLIELALEQLKKETK